MALAFLTSQLYSVSRAFACYEIVDQYDQRHDRQGVNDRSRQMQNETEQPENQQHRNNGTKHRAITFRREDSTVIPESELTKKKSFVRLWRKRIA